MPKHELAELCERLGYAFRDSELLKTALTHRSATNGDGQSNQRLEFLGDAVLGLAVAEAVYKRFPLGSEGELTSLKSRFVNNQHLADVARVLDLGSFLRLGKGEVRGGGRRKPRILADALEAVLGAAFLDGGLDAACRVADRCILRDQPAAQSKSKSRLQEWLQAGGRELPEYSVVSEEGPPHRRVFGVEVRSGSQRARGRAFSKKQAEEQAAALLLGRLLASSNSHSEGLAGKSA